MHSTEALRRERLGMLRHVFGKEGYDGTISLSPVDFGYEIKLSPEPGIDNPLRTNVSGDLDENADSMLVETRKIIAQAMIARRRAQAIIDAGGVLTDPPSWSFIGSPIARAAYGAMGFDLADFRPRTAQAPPGMKLGIWITDFHLRTSVLHLVRNNMVITMDANNDITRIRVLGGQWPETILGTLRGRPLGDVLAMPGVERGTPAGDAPIGKIWVQKDGFGMTVRCNREPMGYAPSGADMSFLKDWFE